METQVKRCGRMETYTWYKGALLRLKDLESLELTKIPEKPKANRGVLPFLLPSAPSMSWGASVSSACSPSDSSAPRGGNDGTLQGPDHRLQTDREAHRGVEVAVLQLSGLPGEACAAGSFAGSES